ncbi:MAG: PQQ-dependent sugar dehydrogenase [Pseudomonas sp.]
MNNSTTRFMLMGAWALLGLAGCMGSTPSVDRGFGAEPTLPTPDSSLLPTVNIAPAIGWEGGDRPVAADGFVVNAFAIGLDHPRWLYALPNGDILVAETNAPERPEDAQGLRGWVMNKVMGRAGAGVPSANRITLLRDTNGDGTADTRSAFAEGLNSPFGMYLRDGALYVANTDALLRFRYEPVMMRLSGLGAEVAKLPAGPRNHHWTKNVIGAPDGSALFVTVGSNSNAAENGIAAEENRAAILRIDPSSGAIEVFASGLRNPNGLAWQPGSGALWTTVNERDELGDNLVPDYMTSVKQGGFYGWPYSYYGQHVDERVKPQRPDLVAKAIVPDYALGAHTASLGLHFYTGDLLPRRYRNGAFIGQHGSWNRKELSGYKVIFVPFTNGEPAGPPEDILTGFTTVDGDAQGRPVGVIEASDGAILVADDVGNVIWRVAPDVTKSMDRTVMQDPKEN